MGLPHKAVVLMSGKTVTLWSHRGWNPSPCWKQRQHSQGSGCHWECFWLLYCELETLWGWDLYSCIALYKEFLNLLASRRCRKANVKQVVLWAVEVMEHWCHWIPWCLVKAVRQPFFQQVFLLSPAACSPLRSRKVARNPLDKWPTVWSWWRGSTPYPCVHGAQQHPRLSLY